MLDVSKQPRQQHVKRVLSCSRFVVDGLLSHRAHQQVISTIQLSFGNRNLPRVYQFV